MYCFRDGFIIDKRINSLQMTFTDSSPDLRELLARLGYRDAGLNDILHELDLLFEGINFDELKHAVQNAQDSKDAGRLISSLKELMQRLENKGCYRPDAPTRLIKLLVNGLNRNEDIFAVLDKSSIPEKDKRKEQEFLASCAAITQLGYILLSCLVPEVKAASAGPHVFVAIEGFSPDSLVFIDFSIESIMEINMQRYVQKENKYYLKNTTGLPDETAALLTQYYSFFQLTSDIGLSHNIRNNLGITYEKIGRYREAVEELNEALRLNPGYVEVHNNLAVTYDKIGKHDEALWHLKEALSLNPAYAEAHGNLGNLYAKLERYEEALEELKETVKLKPSHAPAHNSFGHVYALQNKNQEAISEFKEALRLDPDYAAARSNLGSVYAEEGMQEDALREFQEAIRLEPEFPEAYHGMGLVYYSTGSYERAAQALIRAVYLDPDILECVPDKLLLKVRQGVSRLKGD